MFPEVPFTNQAPASKKQRVEESLSVADDNAEKPDTVFTAAAECPTPMEEGEEPEMSASKNT